MDVKTSHFFCNETSIFFLIITNDIKMKISFSCHYVIEIFVT